MLTISNFNECIFCKKFITNEFYCCQQCNINNTVYIQTEYYQETDILVCCTFEVEINNKIYLISYYQIDGNHIELNIEDFTIITNNSYTIFQKIFKTWDEIWSPKVLQEKMSVLLTFS